MDRKKALGLLGLSGVEGAAEISNQLKSRRAEIEQRVQTAPTDSLRAKYRAQLATVEQAGEILSASLGEVTTGLSSAQIRDLPSLDEPPARSEPIAPVSQDPVPETTPTVVPKGQEPSASKVPVLLIGALALSVFCYFQMPRRSRRFTGATNTGAPNAPVVSGHAVIAVTSAPTGAAVTVDGRPRGSTPVELNETAGLHYLQVTMPGFKPALAKLELVAGKRLPWQASLKPDRSPAAANTGASRPSAPNEILEPVHQGEPGGPWEYREKLHLSESQFDKLNGVKSKLLAYLEECRRRISRNDEELNQILSNGTEEDTSSFVDANEKIQAAMESAQITAARQVLKTLTPEQIEEWKGIAGPEWVVPEWKQADPNR